MTCEVITTEVTVAGVEVRLAVKVGVALGPVVGVRVEVDVRVTVGVKVRVDVRPDVGVRVTVGVEPALTQLPLPASVKVCPEIGMNSQL